GGDHQRFDRTRGQRQRQPGEEVSEPVRAAARFGSGHRPERHRQPDGGDPVGGVDAGAPEPTAGGDGDARRRGDGAADGIGPDARPGRFGDDGAGRRRGVGDDVTGVEFFPPFGRIVFYTWGALFLYPWNSLRRLDRWTTGF